MDKSSLNAYENLEMMKSGILINIDTDFIPLRCLYSLSSSFFRVSHIEVGSSLFNPEEPLTKMMFSTGSSALEAYSVYSFQLEWYFLCFLPIGYLPFSRHAYSIVFFFVRPI